MEEESCPHVFSAKFSSWAAGSGFNRMRAFFCSCRIRLRRTGGQRKPNLDLQTAPWTVTGPDGTTMKAYSALGDGETKAYTAGLTSAGIVNAVERPKKLVDGFVGYAGARVHDSNDYFRLVMVGTTF